MLVNILSSAFKTHLKENVRLVPQRLFSSEITETAKKEGLF